MSVFEREEFEGFILSLKSVEIVHQWGNSSVGKIGGKIFAIFSNWNDGDIWQVCFKCSDISFEMLPTLEGIAKAKYLARAKWVAVLPNSELGEKEIKAYIIEAHKIVSKKLTKKKQNILGL